MRGETLKRRNLNVGMRGPDVAAISMKLRLGDGQEYTRQLGDAVLAWKYRVGFGIGSLNTGMGTRAQAILFGDARRTPAEVAAARARAHFQLKPTRPAKVVEPKPTSLRIITREEWRARAPKVPLVYTPWDGSDLWVHYSAMKSPRRTLAAECAQVRSIQAFHMGASRGWFDIGYGFLVAPSGRVFEGRGYNRVASHCPGHNDEPSVCFLLGDGEEPSKEALAAVRALRVKLGMKSFKPHRAGFSTSCPGDKLVGALHLS